MSAWRRRLCLLLLVLCCSGVAGKLRAESDEIVHRVRFRIHVDLVEPDQGRGFDFWKERLRLSLERATLALQGKQGEIDTPCCTRIAPANADVELETFGRVGGPYNVITSDSEYAGLRRIYGNGVYIVLSLEACGGSVNTGIVGCGDIDGDFIIVDVVDDDDGSAPPSFSANLEYLGLTIAHERGHNAGLEHFERGTCNLMASKVGGGCLLRDECLDYIVKGNDQGGVCSCMGESPGDPPLADGSECGDPESCGLCSGAVCGACDGDAGVELVAVADTGIPAGGIADDYVHVSALTGGWRNPQQLGVELSGLAYDSGRDVVFAVGPGDSGADRLVEMHPMLGDIRRERTLDCGAMPFDCEPIVALAYDADADLLYGVHLGNAYLGQTRSCTECVNNLVAIDPETAVVSRVGEPDYLDRAITGLAYDAEAEILYGASKDDLLAIDLSGCGTDTACPFTYLAATGKPGAGLSIDPRNGRLHLFGNRAGDLTYRVIDPAAPPSRETGLVEPDFTVRVDSIGMRGLAARPVPEPVARSLQLASLAVLGLIALRRRSLARQRGAWRSTLAALLVSVAFLGGGSRLAGASPAEQEIAAAEAMVSARYYEGLPEERAQSCSEVCAARLVEMLEDARETRHHANILRVLGFSSHPGSFEALAAYAAREPRGEVPGAVYNARVEVMLALGSKARHDPRALQLLLDRAREGPGAPEWSMGPLGGEVLGSALQRGVVRGLALSGRPEAGVRLRAMEAAARSRGADRGLLRGVEAALELHDRVLQEKATHGLERSEEAP